jgi:hypothetical protein
MTSFFVALGAVVGLGFVGLLFVWFGVRLTKPKQDAPCEEVDTALPPGGIGRPT